MPQERVFALRLKGDQDVLVAVTHCFLAGSHGAHCCLNGIDPFRRLGLYIWTAFVFTLMQRWKRNPVPFTDYRGW